VALARGKTRKLSLAFESQSTRQIDFPGSFSPAVCAFNYARHYLGAANNLTFIKFLRYRFLPENYFNIRQSAPDGAHPRRVSVHPQLSMDNTGGTDYYS